MSKIVRMTSEDPLSPSLSSSSSASRRCLTNLSEQTSSLSVASTWNSPANAARPGGRPGRLCSRKQAKAQRSSSSNEASLLFRDRFAAHRPERIKD